MFRDTRVCAQQGAGCCRPAPEGSSWYSGSIGGTRALVRLSIQATPFFPGRASGTVGRAPERADRDTILLLTQAEVTTLASAAAAGLVVVGPAPLSHPMITLLQLGVPTVLVTHSQAQSAAESGEVRALLGLTRASIWTPAAP